MIATSNRLVILLAIAAVCELASAAGPAPDLARGALLFQTCSACHTVLGNGLGPDLTGMYGQRAARRKGFAYSPAMKQSRVVWNEATLLAYVKNPQAVVKDTTMVFPGYPKEDDARNVVAYLKTLK